MEYMIKTSASLLACNLAQIALEISKCKKSGVDWVHFDVMDGIFVDQITYGSPLLKSVRASTDMFLDVHLMVEDPTKQIALFAEAGADLITIHVESFCNIAEVLKDIKRRGKKAALALKPQHAPNFRGVFFFCANYAEYTNYGGYTINYEKLVNANINGKTIKNGTKVFVSYCNETLVFCCEDEEKISIPMPYTKSFLFTILFLHWAVSGANFSTKKELEEFIKIFKYIPKKNKNFRIESYFKNFFEKVDENDLYNGQPFTISISGGY